MPESFYNTIVILLLTVVPFMLLLLHTFLATRKRVAWGLVVPVIWTALGLWMIISGYQQDRGFSWELIIFFLGGDLILFGIWSLIRYMKRKKIK